MSATDKTVSRYPDRLPGCLHCKLNAAIDEHCALLGTSPSAEAVVAQPESLAALARVSAELLSADLGWMTRLIRVFRFALTIQADMVEVDRLRARQLLIAGGARGDR